MLTSCARHALPRSLRDAEGEWLEEAGRLACERNLLAGELSGVEQGGAHARELVASCHAALVRGQREQKKSAELLELTERRGRMRAAEQQKAMAADVRALAALLARCTAQRKAEATARKRAAAAPPTAPPTASAHVAFGTSLRPPQTRGVTPSTRRVSWPDIGTESAAAAEAAAAPTSADGEDEEDGMARDESASMAAAAAAAIDAAVGTTAASSPIEEEEDGEKARLAAAVAASTAAMRAAALRRAVCSTLDRRQRTAFQTWAGCATRGFEHSSVVTAYAERDDARAQAERLRSLLKETRMRLASEREQVAKLKATPHHANSGAVKQLLQQVHSLQRRLQQEQALRASEQKRARTALGEKSNRTNLHHDNSDGGAGAPPQVLLSGAMPPLSAPPPSVPPASLADVPDPPSTARRTVSGVPPSPSFSPARAHDAATPAAVPKRHHPPAPTPRAGGASAGAGASHSPPPPSASVEMAEEDEELPSSDLSTRELEPAALRALASAWEDEHREWEAQLDATVGGGARSTPSTVIMPREPLSSRTQAPRLQREGGAAEEAMAAAAAADDTPRAPPASLAAVPSAVAAMSPMANPGDVSSPLLAARARVASILAEVGLADATEDVWAEASAAVRSGRG